MDIGNRKTKGIYALSVIIILSLFVAAVLCFYLPTDSAKALTDTTNAENICDGRELWRSEINKFDATAFNELTDKLFGNKDWLNYVKSMKDTATDSYVIPASVINEKIKNENGIVVTIGGLEWMVASLTVANDGIDNVVATLYLRDDMGTSLYSSSRNNTTKGNNMYSKSILRNTLLTVNTFKLFSDSTAGGFAERFLVQPKNIKYQEVVRVIIIFQTTLWEHCLAVGIRE